MSNEVVIKLPVAAWNAVLKHLYLGMYLGTNDLMFIVTSIREQAFPQMNPPGAVPAAQASGPSEGPSAPINVERLN